MRFLAVLLLAFGLCTAAHANSITVTQVNPTTSILPGQTIDLEFHFTAAPSNTGNVQDTSVTIYDYPSLFSLAFNSPLYAFSLAPGQSTTQFISYLTAFNSDAPGTSTAILDVYSGSILLGSGNYSVTILPTPEPSSIILLGTGMLACVFFARRRFAHL